MDPLGGYPQTADGSPGWDPLGGSPRTADGSPGLDPVGGSPRTADGSPGLDPLGGSPRPADGSPGMHVLIMVWLFPWGVREALSDRVRLGVTNFDVRGWMGVGGSGASRLTG